MRRPQRRELTTEQWKDILRQAADLGALSVRFTGGEPLLRPDFAELYLFARRLGLQVMLFTNARLITPELADLFARVPPLQEDRDQRLRHARRVLRRGGLCAGRLRRVPPGRGALAGAAGPLRGQVGAAAAQSGRDRRVRGLGGHASPGWMWTPSYAVFLDLRTRRDSPAKNRLIRSLRFSPEEGVALAARRGETYRRGMAQFSAGFMGPQGDRLFACGAGETGCVDAYGVYQMCMLLRHPDTVYDLKQGTLREALTEVFPRLRETAGDQPGVPEALRPLLPEGTVRAVPGQVLGGARHPGYPGRVSLPGGACPGALPGTAGRRRAGVGGRGLAASASKRWRRRRR